MSRTPGYSPNESIQRYLVLSNMLDRQDLQDEQTRQLREQRSEQIAERGSKESRRILEEETAAATGVPGQQVEQIEPFFPGLRGHQQELEKATRSAAQPPPRRSLWSNIFGSGTPQPPATGVEQARANMRGYLLNARDAARGVAGQRLEGLLTNVPPTQQEAVRKAWAATPGVMVPTPEWVRSVITTGATGQQAAQEEALRPLAMRQELAKTTLEENRVRNIDLENTIRGLQRDSLVAQKGASEIELQMNKIKLGTEKAIPGSPLDLEHQRLGQALEGAKLEAKIRTVELSEKINLADRVRAFGTAIQGWAAGSQDIPGLIRSLSLAGPEYAGVMAQVKGRQLDDMVMHLKARIAAETAITKLVKEDPQLAAGHAQEFNMASMSLSSTSGSDTMRYMKVIPETKSSHSLLVPVESYRQYAQDKLKPISAETTAEWLAFERPDLRGDLPGQARYLKSRGIEPGIIAEYSQLIQQQQAAGKAQGAVRGPTLQPRPPISSGQTLRVLGGRQAPPAGEAPIAETLREGPSRLAEAIERDRRPAELDKLARDLFRGRYSSYQDLLDRGTAQDKAALQRFVQESGGLPGPLPSMVPRVR